MGESTLPVLSDEERRENLGRAKAARAERAALRARLKSGGATLAEVLASDDEVALRMPVRALLESLPGVGRAKAGRAMDELGISRRRRVRGLGRRQREALLEAFGGGA